MFVRRGSEHVKAENWTAVALDLAIDVSGFLIAFQISDAKGDLMLPLWRANARFGGFSPPYVLSHF